jgi:hypothetical protein
MNSSHPLDFDIGVAQSESYGVIPESSRIFSRREGRHPGGEGVSMFPRLLSMAKTSHASILIPVSSQLD